MTAQIYYFPQREARVNQTPKLIICKKIPSERTKEHMSSLCFQFFPCLGDYGVFATVPHGWTREKVINTFRNRLKA